VSSIVGSTNHMAYVQDSGNVNKQCYGSVSGITEAPKSHDNVHDNVIVINRFCGSVSSMSEARIV
jgi:hypothetical protein